MKRLLCALILLGPLLPTHAWAKLRIVTTLPSLAALARDVGGDLVEVTSLASPYEDPHFVDPRPSLIVKLNRADLLIANGLELEIGWLPSLQVAARNAAINVGGSGYMEATSFVPKLEVPGTRIDRSMGDIHPGGNPHVLFDARAGARVARAIGDRLAALDPAHAGAYRAGSQKVASDLEQLAAEQAKRFSALPESKRRVISYHRSFPYLYEWLGLTEIAEVEPKPGISPDPAHVAHVLTLMRASGVRVIVQEEFAPKKTSDTLAQLAHGAVVTLPGGARFEQGQTFLAHMRELTERIHEALSR